MEIDLPTTLWRDLASTAKETYSCSPERLLSGLVKAHLRAAENPGDSLNHGRAFEHALLKHLNGAPVDLRAARSVAAALAVDANDLLREGLDRVLAEYQREGTVRFNDDDRVTVSHAHGDGIREVAELLEIPPSLLLERILHFWLKDAHDPKHGTVEEWAGTTLVYEPRVRKRIRANIASWRAARAKRERGAA